MLKRCLMFLLALVASTPAWGGDALREAFENPSAEAKPFVRWWWNGGCVTEAEILRELDLLQAAGIGGVEINTIAMPVEAKDTGAKPLTWLSPEWLRMVKVAVDGAKERGMIADLIIGSGWPFGGKFLDAHETIQGVGVNVVEVEGPAELPLGELVKRPKARHMLEDAPPPTALFAAILPEKAKSLADAIHVDGIREAGSDTRITVPAGKHRLYVGAHQAGFRKVQWGAPGADGPVLDHYNRDAVEAYLARVSESLGPVLGCELGDGLRAMFCDSIELSGANWTSDFPEEFKVRRGYDLMPYLPFVLDTKGKGGALPFADEVRRARYDYSKTLVELFHERFIWALQDWAKQNGVQNRYQAYGTPWLMGMLDGYTIPDIPEGDTWLFYNNKVGSGLDNIRYAVWNKYASSGAHLTGRPLVGCESMTNTGGVFRATLEHIKQADDINFITGINHSILHGFNYSPPEAGFPGWVRYGTYFNEQNPWWPHLKHWTAYNARLSAVFQESKPIMQVAILGPKADVWQEKGLARPAFITTPPYLHELWQALHNTGYTADYVSENVIQRAKFRRGRLRHGPMAYEALIVVEADSLEAETAEALRAYAKAGGRLVLVGKAPSRAPGLSDADANNARVRKAMDAILAKDPKRVAVVDAPGEGSLLDWAAASLAKVGVEPGVAIDAPHPCVFQIRHKAGKKEIFFFVNSQIEESVEFSATFPTGRKTPHIWDPTTGETRLFPYGEKKDELHISLRPLESLLLVFEKRNAQAQASAPMPDYDRGVKIDAPLKVSLYPIEGAPTKDIPFEELCDLARVKAHGLKEFGGVIRYVTEFDVEDPALAFLTLGRGHGPSSAILNGTSLGTRWYGERLYDVKGILKPGKNTLEITLATTLYNYCRSLKDNPTAQRWSKTQPRKPEPIGLVESLRLYPAK